MATKSIQGTPSTQHCDNPRQNIKTTCNNTQHPSQIGSLILSSENARHNHSFENCRRFEERRTKLGGTNAMVIIDSFPVGYKKFRQDICINHEDRLILGFAEILNFPPKYHFEFFHNATNQKDNILQIIRRVVLPGSILIIDDSFTDIIEPLKYFYQTVVNVEMLERHNSVDQNVVNNLKQVWSDVITACDAAKDILEVERILESMVN